MIYLPRITKKRIALILLIALAIYAVNWLANHSFIQISLSGADSQRISYTLRNLRTGGFKVVEGSSDKKFLVTRGAYQIEAKVSGKSFIVFINETPRFLGTHQAQGELSAEKERVFVGENPGSCPSYTGKMLISRGCSGIYGEISIHKPAADNKSTFVVTNPDRSIFGDNKLMTTTPQKGLLLIIKQPHVEEGIEEGEEDEEHPSTYVALSLNEGFQVTGKVAISALDGRKNFEFQKGSGNGFTAFDSASGEIYHFIDSDISKPPEKVTLQKPKTANTVSLATDADNKGNYAALYSKAGSEEAGEAISEVVLSEKGSDDRLLFRGKFYTSMRFCGTAKLCLQGRENGLDIYDIAGGKVSILLSIPGVSAIEVLNGRLLAVNNEGVINIDVDSQKGYLDYSLGGYRFNSLTKGMDGYILSVKNLGQRDIALLVDQDAADTDSIDKKVLELQKPAEVSFVSVYHNNVYVAGDLGELVYNNEIGGYTYDPAKKQAVAKVINEAIDRIGIDRKQYSITSNAF